MPFATTYTDLRAAIAEWTDDSSDEMDDVLDAIIAESETEVQRDLDLTAFQGEVAVGSTTIGNRIVLRPATLLVCKSLYITVAGTKVPLDPKTYDYCNMYAPVVATTGVPKYFAELTSTAVGDFYLAPTPAAVYVVRAFGIERPEGLSGSNEHTWLSDNVGDLLLKKCLVLAERFLTNPNMVEQWKEEYADRLAKAKLEFRGMSRNDYLAMRPTTQTTVPL